MTTSAIDQAELNNLSDEEREALEGEEVGSLDQTEQAAKAAEEISDDDAAPAAAAEPVAADEEDLGPVAPRLEPPALDGHQEQIASLLDQRKSIREQYRNGDISAEDKDRLEDEVNDRISDLRAAQKQAEFIENYNQQMAEQDYLKTVAAVKSDIRRNDGIDYDKNPMLLQNWDLKVRALASDPANAGHDGEWYLREAHKQVLSEVEATAQALGFQRTPRGQGPRDPVRDAIRDRRPPETRAKSLAALPAAAADSGHDATEFAHLDSMSGDDLENAVARMSPEQQERWARL